MSTRVCEPILGGGVLDVAFFNGRVLTAEDMQADQAARRQVDARLGRAIGAGVVNGLDVSIARVNRTSDAVKDGSGGGEAALAITPGLALAPSGRSLELTQNIELSLVRPSFATNDAGFVDCTTDTLQATPTGVGLYLLTMCHAAGFRERAPMVGFGTDGRTSGCGSRYDVQGVTFQLSQLSIPELGLSDPAQEALETLIAATAEMPASGSLAADLSRLRNRVAHAFFGTEQLPRIAVDHFALITGAGPTPSGDTGAMTELRKLDRVTADEVPLALLYWTRRGIAFLDVWSVRRRPSVDFDGPAPWQTSLNDRRTCVAEAVWLQFQEHLEALQVGALSQTGFNAVTARTHFQYLPPAGLLPRPFTGRRGFNTDAFFGPLAPDAAAETDGNLLPPLFRNALAHEPVDMDSPVAGFRCYRVRHNAQAIAFASYTIPRIYGVGHFQTEGERTARWEWNRFA